MNKKKLAAMLVSLTLVAVIGAGATLAYFTDQDEATNVITMGHVDIDLEEPNFDAEGQEKDYLIENIVPGEVIVKDPTITVAEDSEAAYIRAKIEFSENLSANQQAELLDGIQIQDGWFLGADGYYYYKDRVEAMETILLFEEVVIPAKWGNETADLRFEIRVFAEAIQADNFEPQADKDGNITAWLDSEGNAITAENYSEDTL